jgi:hypothetical protein
MRFRNRRRHSQRPISSKTKNNPTGKRKSGRNFDKKNMRLCMFQPIVCTIRNRKKALPESVLTEQKKKKIIAWLLGISCLVTAWILISYESQDRPDLQQLRQLDSLITDEFNQYNILPYQVETSRVMVDSLFERVQYDVNVPIDFSKTQLHASLNRVVHPYEIVTPARVKLPEENMNIYLMKQGTIVRSLYLRNDTSLTLQRIPASIMVYFDEAPSENAISEIIRLGEPVPMVLQTATPLETDAIQRRIRKRYNRLAYWLTDQNGETLQRNEDHRLFMDRVEQLHKIDPSAPILLFNGSRGDIPSSFKNRSRKLDIRYIDVSSAQMIDEEVRRFTFQQSIQRFMMQARKGDHPILMIAGSTTNIQWLHEDLSQLKKNGLYLTAPITDQF